MDHEPTERRISKRQLAELWGVSTKSIERYMRRKVDPLPFEKPFEHGSVRFIPSEVAAWWRREGRQRPGPSAAAPPAPARDVPVKMRHPPRTELLKGERRELLGAVQAARRRLVQRSVVRKWLAGIASEISVRLDPGRR